MVVWRLGLAALLLTVAGCDDIAVVGSDAGPRDLGVDLGEDVPAEDVPVDTPVDVPVDTPVDVPVDTPVDVPVDTGPMLECRASADCATSSRGPVCDLAANRCVRCTPAEDVCPVGNYCSSNACVPGCRNAGDCATGTVCNLASHTCVGCDADSDCALGTICRANACVPGCAPGRACGAGSTCCGTTCVNTDGDAAHCGACGNACAAGSLCCAGACADPTSDAAHCGACGTRCSAANGTGACRAGACAVGSCATGYADCDGTVANGCETTTTSDADHCGACGRACTAGAGASARCEAGACVTVCPAGRADCDGAATNGCEVDLSTTATHCGACGNACPARPNAVPVCVGGSCGITCAAGFGSCDGTNANGCEVALGSSATHCGACGNTCRLANATAACAAGACTVGACAPGYADCDGSPANGCEVAVDSTTNCGACGRRCAAGESCVAGACTLVCSSPSAACGASCVNPQTDLSHCGRCNNACPTTPANGRSACASGACALACNDGFASCDGAVANGCETNLRTTITGCGACGRACAFANAATSCVNAACELGACAPGFGNCDGAAPNGCEAPLNTAANCGACGNRCAPANATGACAAGTCAVAACEVGYGDCDLSAANGCERDLRTSSLHCGACGRACAAGQACANGTCVAACPRGTTFCAGGCVTVATDPAHCGACGVRCGAGQVCEGGACGPARPANDTMAGATPVDLSRPTVTFTADNTAAVNDVLTPCLGSNANRGADLYFRLTLTQRELVYADTFDGSGVFDSALFFADAAGVAIADRRTPGDTVCNDDASGPCPGVGTNAMVVTVLDPGTWFLVVTGYGSSRGATPVHLEHLAVGSGALGVLPAGSGLTVTGVLATTPAAGSVTSGTCGGAGLEDAWWWRSCPAAGAATLSAQTCGGAAFDTVVHASHGDGTRACNDNGGATCGLQSELVATFARAARLHALYVDAFATGTGGAYTLRYSRP